MSVASQNQTCFVAAKKLILPIGSLILWATKVGMCLRLKDLANERKAPEVSQFEASKSVKLRAGTNRKNFTKRLHTCDTV